MSPGPAARSAFRIQRGDPTMKQLAGMFILALVCVLSPLQRAQAQRPPVGPGTGSPFAYNISQELTLKGTVSSVLSTAAWGMIPGSHLLLMTPSGSLDVSLGSFGLRGSGALRVTAGEAVEVVGEMKTFQEKQFFLARAVKLGNRIYPIRNEHGIPVSPQGRARASQKAERNGETR